MLASELRQIYCILSSRSAKTSDVSQIFAAESESRSYFISTSPLTAESQRFGRLSSRSVQGRATPRNALGEVRVGCLYSAFCDKVERKNHFPAIFESPRARCVEGMQG